MFVLLLGGCIDLPTEAGEDEPESSFKTAESLEEQLAQGLEDGAEEPSEEVVEEEVVEEAAEPVEEPEVVEEAVEVEEPAVETTEFIETITEVTEGTGGLGLDGEFISQIVCDEEAETLSFNLKNPLRDTISLVTEPSVGLKRYVAFKLNVNGRSVHNLSAWCGAEKVFPNAKVACTTDFKANENYAGILVRTGTDSFLKPLRNYIRTQTVQLKGEIEFSCN